jgi:hypothetical protein
VIVTLDRALLEDIEQLYRDMEASYDKTASVLGLSCNGCPDNCCDSYFLHFTYIEWGYLWYGMSLLPEDKQQEIIRRAVSYEEQSEEMLRQGERPRIMCPLNEAGRCILYKHRLMVCRTHGVPAVMRRPDGKQLRFPGCFRCQDIVEQGQSEVQSVVMERTPLLRRLVELEQNLLEGKRNLLPKVRMTIGGMLKAGPPAIPHCSDRQ